MAIYDNSLNSSSESSFCTTLNASSNVFEQVTEGYQSQSDESFACPSPVTEKYTGPATEKYTGTQKNTRQSTLSSKSFRRFSAHPRESIDEMYREPVGLEPGIDPKTTTVHLDNSVGSEIKIIDYCESKIQFQNLDVFVDDPESKSRLENRLVTRPAWAKLRWININGLSWEALETVAKFYDLHPLSVEDTLDVPQRPKMEVFTSHAFICLPLHILCTHKQHFSRIHRFVSFIISTVMGRSSGGASGLDDENDNQGLKESRSWDAESLPKNSSTQSPVARALQAKSPRSIYHWDRCNSYGNYYQSQVLKKTPLDYQLRTVSIEQVSIFMNKNTVITIFERSGSRVAEPIIQRVLSHSTLIRNSTDPLTLVQAIIDTCVDHIQPIIQEYRGRIYRLQVEAVLHPTMRLTRALHLIKTDLTVLTNTITPILSVLNSFRSRMQTCAAVRQECSSEKGPGATKFANTETTHYFNDVVDHAKSYNNDLKQMMRHADSMSTLIFNTISIQSSDAVKLLSLVTVVFLPLTFLSGYFGMNFTDFDSLNNGLGYYWSLAAPCSAGLIVFLMHDTFIDWVLKTHRWFKGTSSYGTESNS